MAIELVIQKVMALWVPGSVHGVDVQSEPRGLELNGCFEALMVVFAGVEHEDNWPRGDAVLLWVGCKCRLCYACLWMLL